MPISFFIFCFSFKKIEILFTHLFISRLPLLFLKRLKMPVLTRSQSKQINISSTTLEIIPKNSKGHPSVGHLRPKNYKEINPWIYDCVSLKKTIQTYINLYELKQQIKERNKNDIFKYSKWCDEIFKKIFDYVSIQMVPSFDDIDHLLLLCRFLITNQLFVEYEELIINCPEKFMLAYANNSERTPTALMLLKKARLYRVCKYILSFTHDSKLKTWNERRNAHIRGNLLYQSLY